MSEINIKRFVDINIVQHETSVQVGTRDTVVLFTAAGSASTTRTIESYSSAETIYSGETLLLSYLKIFFAFGGKKCEVHEGKSSITVDDLKALSNDRIIVAATYDISSIAATYYADSTIYGVNEKIFVVRKSSIPSETISTKNLAIKYSSKDGAEMTMAAYLSQINVYKYGTVKDYCFTLENTLETDSYTLAETITDAQLGSIMQYNYNVDVNLSGSCRNIGGNCTNGLDLTNSYVKIILHQTLSTRLLSTLVGKIKNSNGLGLIYNELAEELNSYLDAGYLTTDKSWTDDNLVVTYNGQNYTIIEKGTPLISGYSITILPLSSLTTADKAARKCPPVYVIIADSYGIRKITIDGEVI